MSDKKPQVKLIANFRSCSCFLWRNGWNPSRIESVRVSWKHHQNSRQNVIRSNMAAPMQVKLLGRIFVQKRLKVVVSPFLCSWFLVWVMTLQCWRRSKRKKLWNIGIPSLQKLGSKLVQGSHSSSITKDTLIWMMRMLVDALFATGRWTFLASSKLKTTSTEQSKCRQKLNFAHIIVVCQTKGKVVACAQLVSAWTDSCKHTSRQDVNISTAGQVQRRNSLNMTGSARISFKIWRCTKNWLQKKPLRKRTEKRNANLQRRHLELKFWMSVWKLTKQVRGGEVT